MGLGLTFESFIRHLIAEPFVAVESIGHSVKDIVEMLYFYFSQLSLTACYVILFIIAVRFLLRQAPKDYSYGLWVVVYFKLVSPFTAKLPPFKSLVPQHKITEIYTEITPHYSAFYSTEAGFVSIIDSEIITPAALTPVDPWYIPALIWFVGTVVILCIAFRSFIHFVLNRTKHKQKLKDHIYLCNNISTPFVLGIIRPKIFIPQGLTEQEQNYVITHEKSHIKHGDHIWKLIAFFISCIHWFNPLVWLSFFLLEKDMEMSCDERVMQTLGYEHKKDYSRCILSLATNKQFVPKAYLSFGDSDTKKRVKNVLNYKKPAFWVVAIATVVTFGVTFGMITRSDIISYPDYSSIGTNFAKMEENFPDGSDRFHFTFNALQTSVNFNLPKGWSLEKRHIQLDDYPEYLTLDDSFSDVWDIYNADRQKVGAMGFLSYTEYLGNETNLQAIYGAIALPNMYHFDLNEENYFAVDYDQNGLWETATTKVYHSPQLNRDMGLKAETTYGDGILSYDRKCLAFVAFEFEENCFSEKELNYIATSVEISPQNSFESISATVLSMLYRNMETGTDFDVSEYVNKDVLALMKAKEEIAKHRIRVFGVGKDSYNVQIFPYERESWLIAGTKADIKLQVVRTFRYNGSNFDSSQSDVIHLKLNHDEHGRILITNYRIEGKDTTFADMDKEYWTAVENGNGQQFLDEFVQEYKSFVNNLNSKPVVDKSKLEPFPVINQWDFSLKCAAESDDNKYVITYCDDKVTCSTGLMTIKNNNNFDITVHLLSEGNAEITIDVLQNTAVAIAISESSKEYTVGVHADVAENTTINMVICENTHN